MAARTFIFLGTGTSNCGNNTLVGVTVSNLDPKGFGTQLELPLDGPCLDALDAVLDEVRRRIGPAAVTRATLLHRDVGLSHWLFPDEDPEV